MDDLFLNDEDFDIDGEDLNVIDMDSISDDAKKEADEVICDVIDTNNEELKLSSKSLQKIKQHKDTLRLYFKMLRSNEETHDILIQNITMFPHNPQLYTSLSRLQESIMSIKNNISKVIDLIDEFNISESVVTNSNILEDGSSLNRGTRDFIKEMRGDGDGDDD